MLIEKHYKFIALKIGRSYDYFKSFDIKSKDLIFSVEMDEAMNFIDQSDEDIQYYLELVSEKIWQYPQYNNNDSPKVVLLDMIAKVDSNETVYKNTDHLKMTAIKKLTPQEVEALGLEDLSLYQKLKIENRSAIQTYLYNEDLHRLMIGTEKCTETFTKSNPMESLILLLKGEV